MKIGKLNEEIISILKDIEPTFDQNLIVTINQHEEENEKLNDKSKLLEAENKILMIMSPMQQKLIDSLLQHNNLSITQQGKLTTESLTPPSENNFKERNKDVAQTENNTIRQEEMSGKLVMSKTSKPFLEENSRVIQPIETKNCY